MWPLAVALYFLFWVGSDPSVSSALGAEGKAECCVLYARILFITFTAFMLQMAFQVLLVTAEKPQLGLFFTVAAGVSNIVLDCVFIVKYFTGAWPVPLLPLLLDKFLGELVLLFISLAKTAVCYG